MNKRIKMTIGAGIAAVALAIAGGGYYYFHVHTDTPDNAIKTIHEAIDGRDIKTFNRLVDVDSVLDSGYDGFVEGVTSSDNAMTPDAREAIRNFTQMLRAPMIMTLKSAVESYIATGDLKAEENGGVVEILEKTGLNDAHIRDVKNIEVNDADKNEAFADLIIYQPELDREFPLQMILARDGDKQWKLTRVKNFQEFVEQVTLARRVILDEYLAQAGEINAKHEATVREAEQKYGAILAAGSLAQDKTRAELKALLNDVFKKDWEERKQELFSLKVPKAAEPLHNLYMRICDISISAAQDYAKWLDDNNAATIKSAEDKIHQAQDLIQEAADLAKRMTS